MSGRDDGRLRIVRWWSTEFGEARADETVVLQVEIIIDLGFHDDDDSSGVEERCDARELSFACRQTDNPPPPPTRKGTREREKDVDQWVSVWVYMYMFVMLHNPIPVLRIYVHDSYSLSRSVCVCDMMQHRGCGCWHCLLRPHVCVQRKGVKHHHHHHHHHLCHPLGEFKSYINRYRTLSYFWFYECFC